MGLVGAIPTRGTPATVAGRKASPTVLYEVSFTRECDVMPVTVDAPAYRVSPDGVRVPQCLLSWAFEYGRGIYADGFTVATLRPVTLRNAGRQHAITSEIGEYAIRYDLMAIAPQS